MTQLRATIQRFQGQCINADISWLPRASNASGTLAQLVRRLHKNQPRSRVQRQVKESASSLILPVHGLKQADDNGGNGKCPNEKPGSDTEEEMKPGHLHPVAVVAIPSCHWSFAAAAVPTHTE